MLSRSPSPSVCLDNAPLVSPGSPDGSNRVSEPPAYSSLPPTTSVAENSNAKDNYLCVSSNSDWRYTRQVSVPPQGGTWQVLETLSDTLGGFSKRQRLRQEAIALVESLETEALKTLRRSQGDLGVLPHYDVIVDICRTQNISVKRLPGRIVDGHTALWWSVEKQDASLLSLLLQCSPSRHVRQDACERLSQRNWCPGEQIWRAASRSDAQMLDECQALELILRAEDWVDQEFGGLFELLHKFYTQGDAGVQRMEAYLSDPRADHTLVSGNGFYKVHWPQVVDSWECVATRVAESELKRLVRCYLDPGFFVTMNSRKVPRVSLDFLLPFLFAGMSNEAADKIFLAYLKCRQDRKEKKLSIDTAVSLQSPSRVYEANPFHQIELSRDSRGKIFSVWARPYDTELREIAVRFGLRQALYWVDVNA